LAQAFCRKCIGHFSQGLPMAVWHIDIAA